MVGIRNFGIAVRVIMRCMAYTLYMTTGKKIEDLSSSVAGFQMLVYEEQLGLVGKTSGIKSLTSNVKMMGFLLVSIQNIRIRRKTDYSHFNAQIYIKTFENSHYIFMAFVCESFQLSLLNVI